MCRMLSKEQRIFFKGMVPETLELTSCRRENTELLKGRQTDALIEKQNTMRYKSKKGKLWLGETQAAL